MGLPGLAFHPCLCSSFLSPEQLRPGSRPACLGEQQCGAHNKGRRARPGLGGRSSGQQEPKIPVRVHKATLSNGHGLTYV